MEELRRQAESFEKAVEARDVSADDFRHLDEAILKAENQIPALPTPKPETPVGAGDAGKLRALCERHGSNLKQLWSHPQAREDLQALLPGLDEVELHEFVRTFVEELNRQQLEGWETQDGTMQRRPRTKGLFDPPSVDHPPSLLNAICCSIAPLSLIVWNQMFVVLGVAGFPSTWWDVLTLDLNLDGLLKESKSSLNSFISVFGTLLAFVRPTIPCDAPRILRTLFPVVAWFFFSDEATVTGDTIDSGSPESFFYVNGICTTRRMAFDTGQELSRMFGRPFTVIHNPTDCVLIDIVECIFAKLWTGRSFATSRPCALLLDKLLEALKDPMKLKVVLIAHSQGTIIAADVLRWLQQCAEAGELDQEVMKKLEMYNLANAAHWMKQTDGFPYIESICNQRDTVGMLGANAPDRVKKMWNIDIAGPVIYPTTTRWGHMIGAHYLKHLKNGDYPASRLHNYAMNAAIAPEDIAAFPYT